MCKGPEVQESLKAEETEHWTLGWRTVLWAARGNRQQAGPGGAGLWAKGSSWSSVPEHFGGPLEDFTQEQRLTSFTFYKALSRYCCVEWRLGREWKSGFSL